VPLNIFYKAVMSQKSGIYGHNNFNSTWDLTLHSSRLTFCVSPKHTCPSEEAADENVLFSARSAASISSAARNTPFA